MVGICGKFLRNILDHGMVEMMRNILDHGMVGMKNEENLGPQNGGNWTIEWLEIRKFFASIPLILLLLSFLLFFAFLAQSTIWQ